MALIESLLTAIVRADGDALVMHVGEKPHVVAAAGPIEFSNQELTLPTMASMAAQLLPEEMQQALTEFGAVEHELPSLPLMRGDRFTLVVARGGDDIWIEIQRHRQSSRNAVPAVAALANRAPDVHALTDGNHATPPLVEREASVAGVSRAGKASGPQTATAPLRAFKSELVSHPAEAGEARRPAGPAPQRDREMVQSSKVAAGDARESAVDPAALRQPQAAAEPSPPSMPIGRAPNTPSATAQVPDQTAAPASIAPPQRAAASEPAPERHMEIPNSPAPQDNGSGAASTPNSASVVPTTRTLRIEVPQSSARSSSPRSEVERLLGVALTRGATALYLTSQVSPFLRVDDGMQVIEGEPPMTASAVEAAVLEVMPDAAGDAVRRGDPAEWVSHLPEIGEVRCSAFRDYRGPGAIFQWNSFRPMSAEQLGLTPEIQALATETEGLVLIASPQGHGKSTLAGALVDLINRQRSGYVITLERHIRLVHENDHALISQREVRGTTDQVLSVARAALSENADVLVVDEVASAEVFQLALDAAGSGRLVMVSVAAPSITTALTRLVELFPPDQRKEILSLLADRLRGAVAQVLLRKTAGGRMAAREVVLATAAVGRVLADGQLQDLPLAIDSGRKHGLASLTDSLVQLVRNGVVDAREAYRKADDRDALLVALKRENVDTTQIERLT